MSGRRLPRDPIAAQLAEGASANGPASPEFIARAFVTARVFLASEEEKIPALLGTDQAAPLVVGGLVIMGGEGGASKTTLTIDAVAHLASGIPWLGVAVARPLNVVMIENEGPRSKFREKLEIKAEHWKDPEHWVDRTHVYSEPWGRFSFADEGARRDVREYARSVKADLVVADPLGSLGLEGPGSPDETRRFVDHLKDVGLFNPTTPIAFWLLHHVGKQKGRSDVQALSGDWGGHADTIISIRSESNSTLLHWAKARWDSELQGQRWLLKWDGFGGYDRGEVAKAVPDEALAERIVDYLERNPGERSANQITKNVKGARVRIIELLPMLAEDGTLRRSGTEGRVKWELADAPAQETFA